MNNRIQKATKLLNASSYLFLIIIFFRSSSIRANLIRFSLHMVKSQRCYKTFSVLYDDKTKNIDDSAFTVLQR